MNTDIRKSDFLNVVKYENARESSFSLGGAKFCGIVLPVIKFVLHNSFLLIYPSFAGKKQGNSYTKKL